MLDFGSWMNLRQHLSTAISRWGARTMQRRRRWLLQPAFGMMKKCQKRDLKHWTMTGSLRSTSGWNEVKSQTFFRYDIKYQQRIGSEDVYLGMSGRNPGIDGCNLLNIAVKLPGTNSMADITLDVTTKYLSVQTRQ